GFNPMSEPKRLETGGFLYEMWEGLEYSNVGVACNPNATTSTDPFADKVRTFLGRGKIGGEKLSPVVRKFLAPLALPRKVTLAWGMEPRPPFVCRGFTSQNRKAMGESSGAAGGFTVQGGAYTPPEDPTDESLDPLGSEKSMDMGSSIAGAVASH